MTRHHIAALVAAALAGLPSGPGWAEDQAASTGTTSDGTTAEAAAPADSALLTPDEIDTLIAPVALFPDSLLTQVMMATTYPFDVVKADRFLKNNPDLPDKERAAQVEQQDWDPSVQALAAGFPDVISRMSDNIDWTEQMGEAMLGQTEDVLDSIQRMREQAKANGYLESNDAQTVEVTNDNTIIVQPADPEVVYVPTYDSNVVYTQTAPANPVYISDGYDWGDALATGAIVFGTAMILDEIFDNNDPWDNYWRGPPVIDWDNDNFYPRPGGVNINGDVNINDSFNNIRHDRVDIDKTNISNRIDKNKITNRVNGGDRVNLGNGNGRLGDLDREQLDRQFDGSFKASDDNRAAARAKIENRKANGGKVADLSLPQTGAAAGLGAGAAAGVAAGKLKKPDAPLPKVNKPAKVSKPAVANKPAAINKPAAVAKPANISKPAKPSIPKKVQKPSRSSAMERSGGGRAAAASSRGHASVGGRRR